MKSITMLQYEMLMENKDYQKALQFLDSKITGFCTDDYVYKKLDIYLEYTKQYDKLLETLEEVIIQNEKYEFYKIKVLFALGRYDEILKNEFINSKKYHKELKIIQAKIYIAKHDYQKALKIVNTMECKSKEVIRLKSDILSLQMQYDEAIKVLNQNEPSNLLRAILIYYKSDNKEKARKLFLENESKFLNLNDYHKIKTMVIEETKPENELCYFSNLLENYDERKVHNHIKNHYEKNDTKQIHGIFNSNLEIQHCIDYCKEKIKNLTIYNFNYTDEYIVEFPRHIGTVTSINTNKVKVVTLVNSDKIVSIYPIISHYK